MSKSDITYSTEDVNKLVANDWNTNVVDVENERKLDNSVKRFGLYKPIIVRNDPDGPLLQIIGGQHRWESAKRVGIKKVPIINLGTISEEKAKEISLVDNGRYGQDDTLRLAELLNNMGNLEEITEFMPFDEEELNSIFASSEVDLDNLEIEIDDLEEPVSLKKPPQTHQIFRFKIPVGDAESVSDFITAVMSEQGFKNDDDLTNAGDALVYIVGRAKLLNSIEGDK